MDILRQFYWPPNLFFLFGVFVISFSSSTLYYHALVTANANSPQRIATSITKMSSNDDDGQKNTNAEGTRNGCLPELIHTESRGYDIDSPDNVPKRSDYLSWDDYFLAVAYLSAQRSKDPHPSKNCRDGACIVDTNNRIVGIGYDGFPRGCSGDCLPWASRDNVTNEEIAWLHTKEPYLCMAEINAILNKLGDVVGGRMFVGNFPCK